MYIYIDCPVSTHLFRPCKNSSVGLRVINLHVHLISEIDRVQVTLMQAEMSGFLLSFP